MMVPPKRGESDMRFMGFSKSYLPARFAALALVGAFVASLGVVVLPSEAQAGSKKKRNVWSVKYKCSVDGGSLYDPVLNNDLPYFIGDLTDFVVQTTVNIHNPSDNTRRFNKKVVIVAPQHGSETTEVSGKDGISLDGNEAHSIDCLDIVDMLTDPQDDPEINPLSFAVEEVFEGFVVIESELGKKRPVLAVCANYFAAVWVSDGDEGGGVSTQTLCYDPIRTKFDGSFVLEDSP